MRKLSLRGEVCLISHMQELTVDFPGGAAIRNPPAMQELQEMQVQCLSQEDLLEKELAGSAGQPTPVFLPGESHGQRRLAGNSSWGLKESDMTECLVHTT